MPKPTQPSAASRSAQVERFRELAREAETDDRPEEFERVFGKIVPPKNGRPSQEAPKKPKTAQ